MVIQMLHRHPKLTVTVIRCLADLFKRLVDLVPSFGQVEQDPLTIHAEFSLSKAAAALFYNSGAVT